MIQTKNAQVIVPVEDLTNIWRDLIREELNAKYKEDLEGKLLSPEKACKLFNPAISKMTLTSYVNKNLIKKYYIGGRTWFKYSELITAVKEIKKFSHNKTVAQ